MSLKEAKEIPIEDLFEEVTAELLSQEVEAEEATEGEDVPIQPLIDAGVEILDVASVPRYDVERLMKLGRRKYQKVGTKWVESKDFEVSN
jgi:hypothetical protein